MDLDAYPGLLLDLKPTGVLLITINRPQRFNAVDDAMHAALGTIWADIDAAPDVHVSVVTGAGKAFSAGGDPGDGPAGVGRPRQDPRDHAPCTRPRPEHRGFGEADHLGHQRRGRRRRSGGRPPGRHQHHRWTRSASPTATAVGIAAGDHGGSWWPLLCGMAKAKYYLLTSRLHRRAGGRAHRVGEQVRAADRCARGGAGRGRPSWRVKPALRHPERRSGR